MKKTVLMIFGTRPEAIKFVPLIKTLEHSEHLKLVICVSAQHREMLDSVLEEYSIVPDIDLGIMRNDQSLDYLTSAMLSKLGEIMDSIDPFAVLVHGDTTTALAGAVSAFYRKITVCHIEAGLRSGDIYSPFPEEFNRRVISMVASYHFAPTERSRDALLAEGVAENRIFTVGNTAIDTLLYNLQTSHAESPSRLFTSAKRYLLATIHRREHSDGEIEDIFFALSYICRANPDVAIIYPLHKNPRFRQAASRHLCNLQNLVLCEPQRTRNFHLLLRDAYAVLTDSGGVQEEAAFLGKPTLVLRNVTERQEGISAGCLRLVGSRSADIIRETELLLKDANEYRRVAVATDVFGDGHASERIAHILEKLR